MSDLFSEYSLKKQRGKPLSQGLYISPETFIGAVILFALLLIFSFSWGVERGKAIVYREIKEGMHSDMIPSGRPENTVSAVKPKAKATKAKHIEEKAVSPQNKEQPKPAANKVQAGKYAVQLIVYKSEKYAEKEIAWLKQNKYPFIKKEKNGKIIIYAGPYADKNTAKGQMQKLRARYKDCFVKLLKK